MKRIGIIAAWICFVFINRVNAQILHPVHWSYAAKKTNKTEAVIFIKATMDESWHIYSVNQKDGGPLKTGFLFKPSKVYQLNGGISEPTAVNKYEKAFEMDVHYFEKSVVFQQKIKLLKPTAIIKGKISFMTCNDEKCLPPDEVEFSIPIK